jgi:hypothetical protein
VKRHATTRGIWFARYIIARYYDFFVNDQKHQSVRPNVPGIEIKAIARVDYPQQLYLEEEGQTGDQCIADSDFVDLSEKPRRFYLVPSAIVGG